MRNYGISAEYETKEKRQRKETNSLQNAKCVIMESVQNIRQRKRDKEGKQVYYKIQSPHGIAAEYQAEEKEMKKENNRKITNLQTLFHNMRTGALSSPVAAHRFSICDCRHVILCDANQLPVSFSACGEFR